jgi:hypothetical protein
VRLEISQGRKKMPTELPPIRRIVTGTGPDGRSRIVEDGPPLVVAIATERPGLRNANIWATNATPVPVDEPDRIAEHKTLHPPPGGTVIRIMDIPPEPREPATLHAAVSGSRESLFPDFARHKVDKSRHPGMHITDTVDYAIILFGEMYAVMEEGETLMKAGDVLVQRGTSHAWSNRSGENCRVAFILVDGRRD